MAELDPAPVFMAAIRPYMDLTRDRYGMERMTILEREFYRSPRGPAPADADFWRLVFDPDTKRLVVRHDWCAKRHTGVDEFTLDEFLAQDGDARDALIDLLFGRSTATVATPQNRELAGDLGR
jgi:hypothetical protein